MESATAAIDIQNQVRTDGVAIVYGECVGLIRFRALVSAQSRLEGIKRQIQQVKEVVASENVLSRGQVLIYAGYILIGVPARGPSRSEIVRLVVVGRKPDELQFFQCRRIDYGNRVVGELRSGTSSIARRRDTGSANAERIENRDGRAIRRCDRWEHAAPLRNGRHRRRKYGGCPLTVTIIGEEEEGMVLNYRAAKRASELILHVRRIRGVVKRRGIQNLVAKEFVRFTVVLVRPALGAQVDDTAGELAPFRSEVVVLDLKFRDGVLVGNQNRQVDVADVDWLAIDVLGAFVAKGAAYLVIAPAKRIRADLRPAGCSARSAAPCDGSWRKRDKAEYVTAIQRDLVGFAFVDHLAQ